MGFHGIFKGCHSEVYSNISSITSISGISGISMDLEEFDGFVGDVKVKLFQAISWNLTQVQL